MISDINDYTAFAERFVENDYAIPDEDRIATKLLYSSDNYYPDLINIGNLIFRVNYLTDALALEMADIGVTMISSDIKDTAIREEVVIYHKRIFDEEAGKDADLFFVIDIIISRAFVIKRYPGLAGKSTAFIDSAGGVHNLGELSIDDYIENAMAFLGDTVKNLPTAGALLENLKSEDLRLTAYTGNKITPDHRLELFKEDANINLSGQIINQFEIIIYPMACPLIDTVISLVIENDKKKSYRVSGIITREKTLELRKKYRVHVRIQIEKTDDLPDIKAMLVFIKDRFY